MDTQLPTVAMFCFNRPSHTRRALTALAACPEASETTLVVFVDGPRHAADTPLIDEVVRLFEGQPFLDIRVFRSPINKGLFRSVTEGVSHVLSEKEDVIVVEDDLVVASDFLGYMCDAMRRFRDDQRVGCIHGYALPIEGLPDYYFLKGGDCWGWATWRDRWQLFCPDPLQLLRRIVETGSSGAFMDTQGAGSLKMLCQRVEHANQSWAILWHTSLWLAGRLTLHPGKSFVQNIGVDGSGTHCVAGEKFDVVLRPEYKGLPPLTVKHDASAARLISEFLDGATTGRLAGKLLRQWKRFRSARHAARLASPRRPKT